MPPFYGQGMNCGFEDVRVLQTHLRGSSSVEAAFESYSLSRHEDLVAIQKLALSNYNEMSSRVVNPLYLLRKKVDGLLARVLGEDTWCPLYTMVTFKPDIMYSEAVRRESMQQSIISGMVAGLLSSSVLLLGGAGVFLARRYAK